MQVAGILEFSLFLSYLQVSKCRIPRIQWLVHMQPSLLDLEKRQVVRAWGCPEHRKEGDVSQEGCTEQRESLDVGREKDGSLKTPTSH